MTVTWKELRMVGQLAEAVVSKSDVLIHDFVRYDARSGMNLHFAGSVPDESKADDSSDQLQREVNAASSGASQSTSDSIGDELAELFELAHNGGSVSKSFTFPGGYVLTASLSKT